MMVRLFTKHFWVINLLFIAAAAWLVAHLFAVVIQDRLSTFAMPGSTKGALATPAEKPAPYDQYAIIPERNIFNPAEKGLKLLPLEEKGTAAIGAKKSSEGAKTSSLGSYRLVGTVTGPGPHSWAILQEGTDRKQKIVPLHGDIDGGKIVQIFRNRILIRRQGKEEVLSVVKEEVPSRPAASATPPMGEVVKKLSANRFLVNREDVTAAVGNVNQFMTQARIKPHFVAGRPSGFSVSEIQPGSLMEKLGLQNDDVIKKVNGQAITKPEEVFQAYSQLQRDSNIEVEIERGNRSEVFRYEIR
jgi:general secretion pathway protein C